jgi:predicted DNA-binding antitoxin AbrB/MazE fold protein
MSTIRAIYENGVFRPTTAVPLPEHAEVEFEPRLTADAINTSPVGMEKIYQIMSRRFDGQDPEVAARHNEHQP